MSNLDWFCSSKRQNNCSHISRWTLSGLKQLSFTWFSINHVLVSNLIIRIFWGAFVSRSFTFGGMIFISHLLRSLYYSSLNQHCIICYNLILLRHITGDIEWPLIYLDYFMSVSDLKISLIYITSIRISSYKYQHMQQIHIIAQFELLNKIEFHFLTISDYMSHKS